MPNLEFSMIFEGRKYFIVDLFEDNEKEYIHDKDNNSQNYLLRKYQGLCCICSEEKEAYCVWKHQMGCNSIRNDSYKGWVPLLIPKIPCSPSAMPKSVE